MAAWTAPASSPPEGNIAAPINASYTAQYKKGGLILNTGEGGEAMVNGLIVQFGNVGIGTTSPQAKLEVIGNIIANAPTAGNHLVTKSYVDASSGNCMDQYYEAWCAAHQGQKCGRSGTMDFKCVGDFCTKAGISNDLDGDGITGATDCNDTPEIGSAIGAAADGTCDGDADGKIDQTAYLTIPKPAAADCYDSDASKYLCSNNGAACTVGTTCSSGYCVDGYCCNSACGSACSACNVAGNLGSCVNVPDNTDINNDCPAITCNQYIWGDVFGDPSCYKYAAILPHNGMCDGLGACYSVHSSCQGQGTASATCGSIGCWNTVCRADLPASSCDQASEICYVDNATHGCVGNLVCDATGTCKLSPGAACTADNQCGSGYYCGVDGDNDGYLSNTTTGTCMPKTHGDCCDTDSRARPGIGYTYETANNCGSFDYNCDGQATKDPNYCRWVTGCNLSGSCYLCSGTYSNFTITYGEASCGQTFNASYYNQVRILQYYPSCGTQSWYDWYTGWG
ncbi:MAG: hypothetical protein WC974_09960, partial [Thermoplasmata archaeon]